ncbi:MAG: site-2 protease family protein [Chloroflexi bacterium]|nr:site-2 protease family protein [Chloroflexota bacterium]
MKWSWKIGRVAGIDLYMHATFLLLIAFVGFSHWLEEQTIAAVLSGIAFILALFVCVVLHEYGHALTARRFGITTRDITLLPIGGVARLERMPEDPKQELFVALAGPAVNVVIAALLFGILVMTNTIEAIDGLTVTRGSFIERLMIVNVSLVVFNLIPAFPMDGGRVLRALLAMRLDYTQATQWAATLGQGIALIFGFIGFFTNPFLVFIALFVWIGAAQEAGMVQLKSSLGGIPVYRAMITDFRTLSPRNSLADAVELILSGAQQDFPVVDNGQVVGILQRNDLIAALQKSGESALVEQVMRRDFEPIDGAAMLDTASVRLQTCSCSTMPVVQRGQLVGLVTMENLGEFLMIRAALSGKRSPALVRS